MKTQVLSSFFQTEREQFIQVDAPKVHEETKKTFPSDRYIPLVFLVF